MAFRPKILSLSALLYALAWCPGAYAVPGSVEFFVGDTGSSNQDYLYQRTIPAGFGEGEFTLELWIRPNNSFPVGPVRGGDEQRLNWASDDNTPYVGNWWFRGNFLLDGHNNGSGFSLGTFSLQFYGGGRVRWLFGDGSSNIPPGGVWSVGAFPATNTPTLLDGAWHQLTLVRRWSGQSDAQLELWIDGSLVDTEISDVQSNMRQWWDSWPGFPPNQDGWFWGAEKQAAVGVLSQYEDYKGLVDELRFWSIAKSPAEIAANYSDPVTGTEPGLLANYAFEEGQGTSVCDSIDSSPIRCMSLQNTNAGVWSPVNAPFSSSGGDTTAPTVPANLQGTAQSTSEIDLSWDASTDNVGVTGYNVRRNGVIVTTVAGTSYRDTNLMPDTSYSYTVSARDAAGNSSPASAAVIVTTLAAADTEAPTTPTGLQGLAVSTSRVDLSWNASSDNVGVTAYEVRRGGVVAGTTAGTNFSDTGLSANTEYTYTVSARDAAANGSPASAAIMVTTLAMADTQAPTTPGNLQGTAVSGSRIDLTWSASTDNIGVTGYELRRNGALVATTASTGYSDTGLSQSTDYAYTVTARDGSDNLSAESSAIVVTTLTTTDSQPPTAPGNLQGSAASSNRINLTWTASTDDTGVLDYDVLRDGVMVGSSTGTTFADSGLAANTRYVYTVVANDAAGNRSPASAAVGITTNAEPSGSSDGGGGVIGVPGLIVLILMYARRRRNTPAPPLALSGRTKRGQRTAALKPR